MDISKNADGDYIINSRLYTEQTDGTYKLMPISMDEARQPDYPLSYTKEEIELMEKGYVFRQFEELSKVNNSIILDSCEVASLAKGNLCVSLVVAGDKFVRVGDEEFRYAKDMSDEIKERLNKDATELLNAEDIEVWANNWFELEYYCGEEKIDLDASPIDCENYTTKDIITLLEDAYIALEKQYPTEREIEKEMTAEEIER